MPDLIEDPTDPTRGIVHFTIGEALVVHAVAVKLYDIEGRQVLGIVFSGRIAGNDSDETITQVSLLTPGIFAQLNGGAMNAVKDNMEYLIAGTISAMNVVADAQEQRGSSEL